MYYPTDRLCGHSITRNRPRSRSAVGKTDTHVATHVARVYDFSHDP